MIVSTCVLHQLLMSTLLGHSAIVDVGDAVGMSHGPQPVGHYNGRHVLARESVKRFLDDGFRFGVEGGGCLIEE